eukprot:1527408-Amphidinium_carterae.1
MAKLYEFQCVCGELYSLSRNRNKNNSRWCYLVRLGGLCNGPSLNLTTRKDVLELYNRLCVGGTDYNIDPELGLPDELALRTKDPQREPQAAI